MARNELRALGELAAEAASATAARVEEMHRAIAGRSPSFAPHDAIAGGVYTPCAG